MEISAAMVKKLRDETGAGIMECKRALQEAEGDEKKAKIILNEHGLARAEKKSGRVAAQGLIEAYTHAGGRICAMVEVNCESDFVARTDDFRLLAHDLAMQVAATSPRFIRAEDVPADDTETVRVEACLLLQPFIKEPSLSIQDLIKQHVAKLGENIQIRRIARFELGESAEIAK